MNPSLLKLFTLSTLSISMTLSQPSFAEGDLDTPNLFAYLPTELQYHVLSFLDSSTLNRALLINPDIYPLVVRLLNQRHIGQYKKANSLGGPGGHSAPILFASFSPDAGKILTVSADKTAKIWDAESGQLGETLRGHQNIENSAFFSQDGQYVFTRSADNTARKWDVRSGRELSRFSWKSRHERLAAISFDGSRGAIVSDIRWSRLDDPKLQIIDLEGKEEPVVLSGQTDFVLNALFSPNGKLILTTEGAAGNYTIRIFDVEGKKEPVVLSGHTNNVIAARFSPDGKQIVTASKDKTVRIWDTQGKNEPVVLGDHTDLVNSVRFSPDGMKILTASKDKTARIFDVDGKQNPVVLNGHTGIVNSAFFSPDGTQVLTASDDKTVRIWDVESGKQIVVLSGHQGRVVFATYFPDGNRVLTVSDNKSAQIWDFVPLAEDFEKVKNPEESLQPAEVTFTETKSVSNSCPENVEN
jgi:WD40 repeat protein